MKRHVIRRTWSSSTPWNCAAILVVFCTILHAEGILLAPVYWNASNPTFKLSRNSLTIEVNLYDGIDFVCPFYDNATDRPTSGNSSSSLEYYVIYMVSKRSYDACSLSGDTSTILNCSTPRQRRRFTMFFEPFQAIPNAPEFHTGHSYYFITTSTGHKDGLMNADGGACYHHNMKLVISVCCHSSVPAESSSTVPTALSALSSSSLASQSSTHADQGVSNRRTLDTSLLSSPRIQPSSTTTSIVIIHVDPSTSTHPNDEKFSQRSSPGHITTTTNHHSQTSQLPSLSCSHCASNFIFYFSLLQVLTLSCHSS